MGIPSNMAQILLREHNYCAFAGDLLSIARQTVYLHPASAIALVKHECGKLNVGHFIESDDATRGSADQDYITDRSFYSLFCGMKYISMDVSGYEGADLIWDLCQPIPCELEDRFDIIYNGGCLDNIFDAATAIKNMSRMLRPGGRIFHLERSSRVHHAYLAYSLAWFHDYYALNNFADCKVYLTLWDNSRESPWDLYYYNPLMTKGDGTLEFYGQDRAYDARRQSHVVVIAEKGENSTWQHNPVQFQYRGPDAADPASAYVSSSMRFALHARPLLRFAGQPPAQDRQYVPCGVADALATLRSAAALE